MATMTATAAGDEDVLGLPTGWQRLVIPRRRGRAGAKPAVASNVVADYESATPDPNSVARVLADRAGDPRLVALYRGESGRIEDATPTGAALIASMRWALGSRKAGDARAAVDAWVAARGLEFAARATVERSDLIVQETKNHARRMGRASGGQVWGPAKPRFQMAARMRHHLCGAEDAEYAQVVGVLEEYRKAPWPQRTTAAFLVPEHVEWIDKLVARPLQYASLQAPLFYAAVSTDAQLEAFHQREPWILIHDTELLATLIDGAGQAVFRHVVGEFDRGYMNSDDAERLMTALGSFPTDEAFGALLDRVRQPKAAAAILKAAERFPRRGVRLLAESASTRVEPLLRAHVLANTDVAAGELEALSAPARSKVEGLLALGSQIPEADLSDLPEALVTPPWAVAPPRKKPAARVDLVAPAEAAMVWLPVERETWGRFGHYGPYRGPTGSWKEIAATIRALHPNYHDMLAFFRDGPDELVRPLLATWDPNWWRGADLDRIFALRFEAEVLPLLMARVREDPVAYGRVLAPFAYTEVAGLMAQWLTQPKRALPHALAWFTRHPDLAARALIPDALGKSGPARRSAQRALRTLVEEGFEANVRAAAETYGPLAEQAVADTLAQAVAPVFPKVMPTLPSWTDPSLLPQVLLVGGGAALPRESVRNLCLMLAISTPQRPLAALDEVRAALDPASLASFVWAVFEGWRLAGMPAGDSWALEALGVFGDDAVAARLAAVIRIWPGESAHRRAVQGLDVLAEIGGNTALAGLYGISRKVKFKALKDRAVEKVKAVADALELSAEQLGDRLIPDLGLDAAGVIEYDFGPRTFTVSLDERLKPVVRDADGKPLKDLPKAGAADDPALAAEARAGYSEFKKATRSLAADQIGRLEQAMIARRRWPAQEFRQYIVGHPVVFRVARALLWGTYAEDGSLLSTFRIAEDRTFADVADDVYVLEPTALVGIVHLLDLGDEAAAWSELFADYALLQPFDQLGRIVLQLTEEEKSSEVLHRFDGLSVATGKVVGLERFGWHRGDPADHGIQTWMSRPVPGGGCVALGIEPGISMGNLAGAGHEQTITEVWVTSLPEVELWRAEQERVPLGTLDAVTAAEILRDLTALTSM
ncbi:DUF4132 domain-containing protein [Actinospica durhamensis]|uniref:DUF4132 domain-containing protein n=1 Tax=Actinospica durhamensis TaxID=1508375 RepID=A0A941EKC7_9ACTN|nr:DUF4132 domain-containing protein [Actinospica durhamensis]MBR7832117.1 DUF4132 domain-containing protein [Actinospica durhamensis]